MISLHSNTYPKPLGFVQRDIIDFRTMSIVYSFHSLNPMMNLISHKDVKYLNPQWEETNENGSRTMIVPWIVNIHFCVTYFMYWITCWYRMITLWYVPHDMLPMLYAWSVSYVYTSPLLVYCFICLSPYSISCLCAYCFDIHCFAW